MSVIAIAAIGASRMAATDIDPDDLGFPRSKTGSIARLPASVKPPPDVISLIADYKNASKGVVWLYLVNRTDAAVSVPTQDGDAYAKRESPDAKGKWKRCDTHFYSWCGNSYISHDIPAGYFFAWKQKLDSGKGEKRPVRFRMHQEAPWNLISNQGTARIDPSDIEKCRLDAMAMREDAPLDDIFAVAMGEVKGGGGSWKGGELGAIGALTRFARDPRLFDCVRDLLSLNRTFIQVPDKNERAPVSPSENRYDAACYLLNKLEGDEALRDKAWRLFQSEVLDRDNPWRRIALHNIVYPGRILMREEEKRIQTVLDRIIRTPDDSLLERALSQYHRFAEKMEARKVFSDVQADPRYPEMIRQVARDELENLLPNPFLIIKVTHPERPEGQDLTAWWLQPRPLITVKITNISPQTITLRGRNPSDLLVLRLFADHREIEVVKRTPQAPSGKPEPLTLKPGETFEMTQVNWWELIDPTTTLPGASLSVSIYGATPGLWEIPAKRGHLSEDNNDDGLSWIVGTDHLKRLLRRD